MQGVRATGADVGGEVSDMEDRMRLLESRVFSVEVVIVLVIFVLAVHDIFSSGR